MAGSCRYTRRDFLAAFGAASAATVAAGCAHFSSGRQPLPVDAIDVHHHIFPPSFVAAMELVPNPPLRAPMLAWSPGRSLAEMDANGIESAVVSITNPGIWFGNVQAARTLARDCNEYSARLAKDYPGRFGFFASIPLPDTEGSLNEIQYSLDVLGADGFGLLTSYGDRWPGDPAFQAVFDQLNRRRAIVYFHPTTADCCRQLVSGIPDPLIEFPHDTSRAIVSLLYSGTFARYRNIRFIFSHAGGTIPMLAGRLIQTGALFGMDKRVPSGVEIELAKLYYEVANSANPAAMAALTRLVPMSQILFGSDYPFIPIPATAASLPALDLSSKDLKAIQRSNALAIFPRVGRG